MEKKREPSVVVIDDSVTAVKLVELALKSSGVKIVAFNSAGDAELYLEQNTPSLIILDIVMPEKDGLTFLEEIRQAKHQQTPVIMFTSKDYYQDRKTSEELGALDFIVKPISIPELRSRICNLSGIDNFCDGK